MGTDELIAKIDKILKNKDDSLKKELKEAGYEEIDYTIEKISELEDTISDLLTEELKHLIKDGDFETIEEFMEYVESQIGTDNIDTSLAETLKSCYQEAIENLGDTYLQGIDKDLSLTKVFSPYTTTFIDEWSSKLGEMMKLTSHEKLQNILDKALEDGESVEDVVGKLSETYGFSRTRARATAITEMLRAHSYAKDEAFNQCPAVTGIQWKHSGGRGIHPRQHHVDLDGTVINKGEYFTVGIYEARFPRDINLPASETVNCHCTHGPVIDKDILGLSKEEKEAIRDQVIAEYNL